MDWKNPAHQINKGLLYEEDDRRDLELGDDEALSVFLTGWSNANNPDSEDFGENAFRVLSWHNLGYRLGLLFGETPSELKEDMYYWCVEQKNA
ncbi:Uncharacterized protein AArcCO_4139 (plasmid) [Halalkaliarchaeum sp. AArc-CO]|uniref:hypothetical protein n=1 Tax=Halalkaliarchaeum sp. AArc-CO TaxID=2866381 RepID=UPI00217D1503|nr:hypothetical protein [Halalkaliarchaeum sp. AArc-CO]UWG49314.1 Uncharacterized protein AArcCO_4139 [Halalkaliarchaeum sp. AArc-CO]